MKETKFEQVAGALGISFMTGQWKETTCESLEAPV